MGKSAPARTIKTTSRFGSASSGTRRATRSSSGWYSLRIWKMVSTVASGPTDSSASARASGPMPSVSSASLKASAREMTVTRLPICSRRVRSKAVSWRTPNSSSGG